MIPSFGRVLPPETPRRALRHASRDQRRGKSGPPACVLPGRRVNDFRTFAENENFGNFSDHNLGVVTALPQDFFVDVTFTTNVAAAGRQSERLLFSRWWEEAFDQDLIQLHTNAEPRPTRLGDDLVSGGDRKLGGLFPRVSGSSCTCLSSSSKLLERRLGKSWKDLSPRYVDCFVCSRENRAWRLRDKRLCVKGVRWAEPTHDARSRMLVVSDPAPRVWTLSRQKTDELLRCPFSLYCVAFPVVLCR